MKNLPTDLRTEKSTKLLVNLFMLWLLTLPFGSKLASFSIGFMTLNPNMIIGLLFVLLTLKQLVKQHKGLKWTLAFLLIWFLFGVIYLLFTGKSEMGIFHIRTLGMQVLFATIIFNATTFFGWADCRKYLIQGLKIFLNLLLVVGFFEVFSGMHEVSIQTAKFLDLEVSKIFYGPMFIFENQNDFICYSLFLLLILIVLDVSFRNSKFKILFYAAVILFFSFVSDSTFGNLAAIGIISLTLIFQLITFKIPKRTWIMICITTIFLLLTIMQRPLFYGPKFSDHNQFAGNMKIMAIDSTGRYVIKPIKQLISPSELNTVMEDIRILEGVQYNSATVRKNLILNGIEFSKKQPIIGIGPGNFFNKLENNEGYYPTGTVRSPHNFVIEIISQYGIIGWTYLVILFYLFIGFILKWRKEKKQQLMFVVGVFPIISILWLIPSSYLYLDINWLFLPIMICSFVYFSKHDFEGEE